MELQGKAVSAGYAVGKIFRFQRLDAQAPQIHLTQEEVSEALETLERSCSAAARELESLRDRAGEDGSGDIFTAHLDILRDRVMNREIRSKLEKERMGLLWAVETVYDKYKAIMQKAKNPMFQERAADFEDVKGRLMRCCMGMEAQDLSHLGEPVVLMCHDLLPSDTANLDRTNVLAIVTEVGGETSHSAILARNYEIPAVLGVECLLNYAVGLDTIAVDAVAGKVILDPDESTTEYYSQRRQEYLAQAAEDAVWYGRACSCRDGTEVGVYLNIASDDALEGADLEGIDGVGLLRTEFLYMHSKHIPTEEEQLASYQRVLRAARGRPIVLRTLDIGGDKSLDYFPLPKEENPFLGERALRLCLRHTDLFQTQLRAALRASVCGQLWIMFPMVGSIEDIRAAKEQLTLAKKSLDEAGLPYDPGVKVGIMIEIPAIALVADLVAAEVDFASIGSNDLIQYTEAADRMNPAVSAYYEGYHPAVYRLIGYVAEQFRQAGKPLSICGEMAGDPRQAMLLTGLGLRKLSMSSAMVSGVKKALAGHAMDELEALARKARSASTAQQVRDLLREI